MPRRCNYEDVKLIRSSGSGWHRSQKYGLLQLSSSGMGDFKSNR